MDPRKTSPVRVGASWGEKPGVKAAGAGLFALAGLVLALAGTWKNSATVDEYAHLPAGVYYWRTGDFSLYDLNPPLARLMAAAPVMPMNPKLDLTPEIVRGLKMDPWGAGNVFFHRNAERYDRMLLRGRLANVVCGAVLAGVVCLWSWRLFGWAGGVVSGAASAFSPDLLAHAGLATPDVPLTLFWTLTGFAAWETAYRPRWGWTGACGIFLGLALLTKYNALILAGVLPLTMMAAGRLSGNEESGTGTGAGWKWRPLGHGLVAVGLALVLVGAFYGYEGFLRPPGDAAESRTLKAVSWVPMPLPTAYVQGLDKQLAVVEKGEGESYLNGETYRGSRWYYYPEAFLLKEPGPTLGLMTLAVAAGWVLLRSPGPAFAVLAVPAAVFLVVNMFLGNLNIGLRYVLPVFPAIFIGLGAAVCPGRWFRARLAAAGALVLALAVVVTANCPHYISYFNRIAGGREGGPRYLLDSNIDWGQDLKRLAEFLHERGVESVKLAYFGYVPLEHYGIKVEQGAPTPETKGWVAVSVQYLYRMSGGGSADDCAWLREREPAARIGGSIYVYHLERRER